LSYGVGLCILSSPTTFVAQHQGLPYTYVTQPPSGAYTYLWENGQTLPGGPQCSGPGGLAALTFGGTGALPTVPGSLSCVRQHDWDTTPALGTTCPGAPPPPYLDDLLLFLCSPS
jgi:hypothetical protein